MAVQTLCHFESCAEISLVFIHPDVCVIYFGDTQHKRLDDTDLNLLTMNKLFWNLWILFYLQIVTLHVSSEVESEKCKCANGFALQTVTLLNI